MNRKNLLGRIGGFVLAASLLCCVAIMSNTAVQAQGRGRGFHGGGFHTRIFIGPRFGWGNPYGYYGYPYGDPYRYHHRYQYGYPYRYHYRYFHR
jgi:hypothetical protein